MKKMQIVQGTPYIYDMRFYRTHIHARTHTHAHTFRWRVHTQWLLERETAVCAGVRELVRIRVRANRRFTQTRSIVLRGMRAEMCVHPRAHVYVDPRCVRATRRRVHRRH